MSLHKVVITKQESFEYEIEAKDEKQARKIALDEFFSNSPRESCKIKYGQYAQENEIKVNVISNTTRSVNNE